MIYPKIKFRISEHKDIETYFNFWRDFEYSKDKNILKWAFYTNFPELRKIDQQKISKEERRLFIKKFVHLFYQKNAVSLRKRVNIVKKDWEKISLCFFQLTDRIFKNHPWPKGKYIAYPTMWGMYPRDLENKCFQFPFRHKKRKFHIFVIAHEMLHFIFYDYVYKHFPKYKNKKYQLRLWDVSEAFNVVIQSQKEWIKIFKEKPVPYPQHKELVKAMKKQWRKNKDIDVLLKKFLP